MDDESDSRLDGLFHDIEEVLVEKISPLTEAFELDYHKVEEYKFDILSN